MEEKQDIQKAFSGKRIWLGVLFGLIATSWMLWNAFQEVHFEEQKHGDYVWVDGNKNHFLDAKDSNDFAYVGKHKGNYGKADFYTSLQNIQWSSRTMLFLGLALLFVIGRDFFYMLRIRILTKKEITWKRSFIVIMLWEFASALSPGVLSGASVAMFILKKEGVKLGKATSIVIITALLDNLFYILLVPSVFLLIDAQDLFPKHHQNSTAIQTVFWTGYSLFLGLFLVLFSGIFFFPSLITKLLSLIFSLPFLKKWKEGAIQTGKDMELTSREMRHEPFSFWFTSFLATCGSWISRYLVINIIMHAFISLNLLQHFMILGKQFVLWLLMRVSPTPGASGVAEYAFGELMGTFSASLVLITVAALIWRLLSYFPYLIIGSIILPKWLGKK